VVPPVGAVRTGDGGRDNTDALAAGTLLVAGAAGGLVMLRRRRRTVAVRSSRR
jgi:LPXTG-motif cell wall-anchored protein